MNLGNIAGTFSNFVASNAKRLAGLKTQEELLGFFQEGINSAKESKSLSDETAAKYMEEAAQLNVKKLQAFIYNMALAGEGLKTVKIK